MDKNIGMASRYEHEIPEGYEARIEGNKVIIELKESEDERVRKELIAFICQFAPKHLKTVYVAWLEKQGKNKHIEPSLEDKKMVRCIGNAITTKEASDYLKENNIEVIDAHVWLENLLFEDKTGFPLQWKPSDEQMATLFECSEQNNSDGSVLRSLYNDLKALCDK